MRPEIENEIRQLESAIAETEEGIAHREQLMREGHAPIDLEIARVRLFGMKKALQRLQGEL